MGYIPNERSLKIDWDEATRVRKIFSLYLDCGCVSQLKVELDKMDWRTPSRSVKSRQTGNSAANTATKSVIHAAGYRPFSRGHLYRILNNPIYIGKISHKGEIHDGQHQAIIDMPLWNAVQQQLLNQTNGQRRENTQIPKLLVGILFDANGQKLTPTYSKKGTRLYQYYVSNDLHQGQRTGADQFRIPALDLEQAVLDACIAWFEDEKRLLGHSNLRATSNSPAQILAQAQERIGLLQNLGTQFEALRRLVQRITIYADRMEIELRGDDETQAIGMPSIVVPIRIKRLGLAVRLIVGNDTARPRIDKKLLALIDKGLRWFELLKSGKCESLAAIGLIESVGSSYVSRVMNLAFLCPDILQVIASGRQPEHVTADRLMRMGMPPVKWIDQWQWLGMQEIIR